MAQVQKSGQTATVYISPLAAEIAQARHHRFFSAKADAVLIDGGPHLLVLQSIDRLRARWQQKSLRRLQRQVVAIGTYRADAGSSVQAKQHETFDAAYCAYHNRRADHEITVSRMASRRARFAPAL